MLTRKIIFCALAVLCIAAGAAAQEENYFAYPEGSTDPASPPVMEPMIDEPQVFVDPNMPAILPRPREPSDEEYSFNEIMEEIQHHEGHEGKEGRKKHSNSPKRGAKPSKKGDKKHAHPTDAATTSSSSSSSSSGEDHGNIDNLQSSNNHEDSIYSQGKHMRKFKRFSKKGRIVFGVIFLVLASATLFCCVRKCKKRCQAKKERKAALDALRLASNDSLQTSQADQVLGTPINVPASMTMVYSADGSQPIATSSQGPIAYYVMPQQFSYPAANHQMIEMPVVHAQTEAQQIAAPRYPILNAVVQPQPHVVCSYPQAPQGYYYK